MSSTVDTPRQAEQGPAAVSPALSIRNVHKTFRLPHQRYSTLKERALHPFQRRTFDELRAVDDVTVDIAPGEFFGIVGRNGSGKSTLLKCLAGIYEMDSGSVTVEGRLSPFIELGVGFNMDLTARDNVVLNAIMLGLTPKQARERFDEIIAFAELEEFLDLKLKNYSSGMNVRLAFSVAIQVDADVLLVDEVLAVGDAAFQKKCFDAFHRLKAAGKTIIFVTHDMSAVERFCDRAMLLERGKMVSVDAPDVIARAYNQLNFGQVGKSGPDRSAAHPRAEIRAAWVEDADGGRVASAAPGEPLRLCAEVAFHQAAEHPEFAFHLRNAARHTVFATSTHMQGVHSGHFAAGDVAVFRVHLTNWFAPGRYDLTPTVSNQGGGYDVFDVREDLATLIVGGTHVSGGVVDLPHTLEVARR